MDIRYLVPFNRAWERMKKALFKPFDLKKWFVVGFTAFLAGLLDSRGGDYGVKQRETADWDEIMYFPQNAWEWLQNHPEWMALIITAVVLVIALIVVLMWLSSRGKFMFLDNVIHDRAQVIKPWHEFKTLGNSLFNWRLVFALLAITTVILYVYECYTYLFDLYTGDTNGGSLLFPLIWMVLGLLAIILIIVFIDLLLNDFIVPIMYRSGINTTAAWRQFLPLLSANLGYFIGYVLLVILIIILVIIGIIVAGLLTCCLGFLLLIIPYINSVVLLPISYTLRAFSVEFLEQFGPDYHIFPERTE